jgi:hypothetical protein
VRALAALGGQDEDILATAQSNVVTIALAIEDVFDVAEDHFDLYRSMVSYVARERARLAETGSADAAALILEF